jgi:hypothetical protein
VREPHEALAVNEIIIRDWFKRKRLTGLKIGTASHISQENWVQKKTLGSFLNAARNLFRHIIDRLLPPTFLNKRADQRHHCRAFTSLCFGLGNKGEP